jgi:hypothetical protein
MSCSANAAIGQFEFFFQVDELARIVTITSIRHAPVSE